MHACTHVSVDMHACRTSNTHDCTCMEYARTQVQKIRKPDMWPPLVFKSPKIQIIYHWSILWQPGFVATTAPGGQPGFVGATAPGGQPGFVGATAVCSHTSSMAVYRRKQITSPLSVLNLFSCHNQPTTSATDEVIHKLIQSYCAICYYVVYTYCISTLSSSEMGVPVKGRKWNVSIYNGPL